VRISPFVIHIPDGRVEPVQIDFQQQERTVIVAIVAIPGCQQMVEAICTVNEAILFVGFGKILIPALVT
jgi:hypothetical protein